MQRQVRTCPFWVAVLLLAGTTGVPAQSSLPVLESSLTGAGRYAFSKLSALAVSEASDRWAVADENLNRVFVMQSNGRLDYVIGESGWLNKPTALLFETETSILIVTRDNIVRRVFEATPEQCDTVADLSTTAPSGKLRNIAGIAKTDEGYLVLDNSSGDVCLLDSTWAFVKVVIGHGRGRGKVWEPAGLARDIDRRLVIADRGDFPIQVFSPQGALLFVADWNMPDRQRTWEASAVAVSRQGLIWAADQTNRQWRLYDQSGSQVATYQFQPAGLLPGAAVITLDNRLIAMDERGTVQILSILQ